MRYLHRALLCATALAALLATAAPASAQLDPDEWKAVDVRVNQAGANDPDCGATVTCGLGDFPNDGWGWRIDPQGGGSPSAWTCDGGFDGEIGVDGGIEIDDIWWSGGGVGSACQTQLGWDFGGLPSESEICYHEPTEEYWVRVPLTLEQYGEPRGLSGDTFGRLANVSTGYVSLGDGTSGYPGYNHNANAIAFRGEISGGYTPLNFSYPYADFSHRGTIPLERSIEVTPTEQRPCSSPYLN